jgi:hypothetical protein
LSVCLVLFLTFGWDIKPAAAAFIQAFSGNTKAATTTGSRFVTINFAALDRLAGGTPGDVFGTGWAGFDSQFVTGGGSAAFDTTARYLYLYQPVIGAGSGTFATGVVGGDFRSISSYQQWELRLSDAQGVTSTANAFGIDSAGFTANAPANPGVLSPAVNLPGSDSLTAIRYDVSATQFRVLPVAPATVFSSGMTLRLYGYTSNLPPEFEMAPPSTSTFATGVLPGPATIPEPQYYAALGCLALYGVLRWRSKRSASTV